MKPPGDRLILGEHPEKSLASILDLGLEYSAKDSGFFKTRSANGGSDPLARPAKCFSDRRFPIPAPMRPNTDLPFCIAHFSHPALLWSSVRSP
jgi:hypothetical protein